MTYGRVLGVVPVGLAVYAAVSHGLTSSPPRGEGTERVDGVALTKGVVHVWLPSEPLSGTSEERGFLREEATSQM
jgi:hypothetical protein